jgi:hypothetical protein
MRMESAWFMLPTAGKTDSDSEGYRYIATSPFLQAVRFSFKLLKLMIDANGLTEGFL